MVAVHYLRRYLVAFGAAVALHAILIGTLQIGLDALAAESRKFVIEPKPLKAQIVQFRKPTAAQSAIDSKPQVTAVSSIPDKVQSVPDEEVETAEEQRERLERERQQRLTELKDRAFHDALGDEVLATRDDILQDLSQEYISGIYFAVVENWNRPPSARNDMSTVVQVELFPNGEVNSLSIIESSGNEAFDRSTLNAIHRASPFLVPDDLALFEERFRSFTLNFKPEDLFR